MQGKKMQLGLQEVSLQDTVNVLLELIGELLAAGTFTQEQLDRICIRTKLTLVEVSDDPGPIGGGRDWLKEV